MSLVQKLKPGVKKRTLLYVAGCAWSIAGGMLITRALIALIAIRQWLTLEIIVGVIAGSFFYIFMFTRISKKHITRISLIEVDNPCFFSFFNVRSYILMTVMISAGITLRKTNVIAPEYLYTFYLAMGLPLLLSAFRFFKAGIKNVIRA